MHCGVPGSLLIASGGGVPAGQLPAWHSSTKLAHFRFVEDKAQGSAARIVEFAPNVSFDRLIQSILKLEHGLRASRAWSGTDMEELQDAETAARSSAGLGNSFKQWPCMAATGTVGALTFPFVRRPAVIASRRWHLQCNHE